MKRLVLLACLLTMISIIGFVTAPPTGAASPTQAPPAGEIGRGKSLFLDNCSRCHGPNGDGRGPDAATLNPKPATFSSPQFWQGDMTKKIQNAVKNGKGAMPPADLKADEIKAVIAYLTATFKPGATK